FVGPASAIPKWETPSRALRARFPGGKRLRAPCEGRSARRLASARPASAIPKWETTSRALRRADQRAGSPPHALRARFPNGKRLRALCDRDPRLGKAIFGPIIAILRKNATVRTPSRHPRG